MSERQPGPYDSIARRWLALVERRQQHCIELCDSGRWRHYYSSEAEFIGAMQELLRLREQWAALAGPPALADTAPSNNRDVVADGRISSTDGTGSRLEQSQHVVQQQPPARPAPLVRLTRTRGFLEALPSAPWPS
jgi:uncharacterized repeat protein (TIGR03809 family)